MTHHPYLDLREPSGPTTKSSGDSGSLPESASGAEQDLHRVSTAFLTDHEINWSFSLPDEQLAALPLVSTHREPQIAPQEYECGCITVTRITDRDSRYDERPFEMRLAKSCGSAACEVRYVD